MRVARGKYHIWTVGCQMNMADSQRVSSILDGLGWEEVPTMETANLVVLNTCSVREQPEKRAHGQLSLLGHAKKQRSDLLVAMMGCMIGNQRTIDDLKKRYPAVDLFFKVEKADILPQFLAERWTPLAGEGCIDFGELGAVRGIGSGAALTVLPALPAVPMQITPRPAARDLHYPTSASLGMKTRGPTAWLPVILGCNKVCSYCIVPSRRGVERSRPLEELVTEASDLVAAGARELTLLGQTVEAYGLDLPEQEADLGDLMEHLGNISGLERIRFMTSYPRHFSDKLIKHMARLPKVCPHVNIPVQHGDDAVLRRMRRGYTLAEYRVLIDKLRAWWPGVSLSTDVIVGFCGETDEEFQHTLDLLQEIRFDVVHVAAYSPRPGTLSFKWEDDIPLSIKKERLHAVEAVQERISTEINAGYLGCDQEVLVEAHQVTADQHQWRGRNRSNKLVFFPSTRMDTARGRSSRTTAARRNNVANIGNPAALAEPLAQTEMGPGDLVLVHIEKTTPWSLQGRLAMQ
ncbi:MAG: MiaB/RimO family radical SAM methylthiotransferase [Ktedonobacterales bacterium]